jgi:hypothetical protein
MICIITLHLFHIFMGVNFLNSLLFIYYYYFEGGRVVDCYCTFCTSFLTLKMLGLYFEFYCLRLSKLKINNLVIHFIQFYF